ncbi:MAG TPA: double-cubane-cluster-containing anaerobic reductase [Syntrophales bacterium]|nr:double-cubane-cluster-containing anaerobic reductase [Syntrophales bacterium]
METKPLFNDEFAGAPAKRVLAHLLKHKGKGDVIAGTYCGYAPLEVFRAMGIVPAVLCAFANNTVAAGEAVLPSNLCPLIKSSMGFIETDTCPFFSISQAVIAETTCDGKKKMFEFISERRPMYIMNLPHIPERKEAAAYWLGVVRDLKAFLESVFGKNAEDADLEAAIKDSNEKNRRVMRMFGYAALDAPALHWSEMLDTVFLATPLSGAEINGILDEKLDTLAERAAAGRRIGDPGAPRVLITGSPVAGDAVKVYKIIEDEGGVIVEIDSCVGTKPFRSGIKEDTGDPLAAIAERYLSIPCSCMTPNLRRMEELSARIEKTKPDVVIDVVLHACHSYNIESSRVEKHVREKHGIRFLKIVTDYAPGDAGQLKTRIGAALEMAKQEMS